MLKLKSIRWKIGVRVKGRIRMKLSGFIDSIRRNKKEIMVIVLWIAIVSMVVILTYYSIYITSEKWRTYEIAFSFYEAPLMNSLAMMVIVIISGIAGVLLRDSRKLVIGYGSTIISSFLIAVAFSFCYIWFVLGYEIYGLLPYGWEWILLVAVLNIARLFIPTTLTLCLIGITLGSILRVYLFNK